MKSLNGLVFSFAAVLSVAPSVSSAHHRFSHADCITEVRRQVSTTTLTVGSCKIETPLAKTTTTKIFPKLDAHAYRVDIWEGSYAREIKQSAIVKVLTYDQCNGVVLDSHLENESNRNQASFAIVNPNLDDTYVDATFKLVPMVQEEAEAAMNKAHADCANWKP